MAGIAFHSVVDAVQEKLALQANLELGRGMLKDMTIRLFNSKTTHTVTHRKALDNNGLTWVSWVRLVGNGAASELSLRIPCVNSSHP